MSAAIAAATARLFELQRADGRWVDVLQSTPIGTGPALIALHLANSGEHAEIITAGSAWLRASQNGDGGWGDEPGAASTMFATAQALAALTLVDAARSASSIRHARNWMEAAGGWQAIRQPTTSLLRVSAFLLRLAREAEPAPPGHLPAQLVYFPGILRRRLWIGVAGYLAWAVYTSRWADSRRPRGSWVRARAVARCLSTLRRLQGHTEPLGGFLDSAYYTSSVCIPLCLAGVGDDIVHAATRYLRSTVRADGSWSDPRSVEVSATALITSTLLDAGYTNDRRVSHAVDWLRSRQQQNTYPVLKPRPGGWTWSLSSQVPDVEDTAFAIEVLLKSGAARDDPSLGRAVRWLMTMQNNDGSWNGFVRGTRRQRDAPCPVFVADALTALAHWAASPGVAGPGQQIIRGIKRSTIQGRINRGRRWLESQQRIDGSFPSIWYRESTIGTAAALDALCQLGEGAQPVASCAKRHLLAVQHADGGWGDGADPGGESTVEESAWSVYALSAYRTPDAEQALADGVRWLIAARGDNHGLWSPTLVATHLAGFSRYRDDLMATAWALRALVRYRNSRFDHDRL